MIRKVFVLFLIPVIQIALHTACKCDEFLYYDITGAELHPVNDKGEHVSTVETSNGVILQWETNSIFISANKSSMPSFSFISAANAKCQPNGDNGLKQDIKNIDVYSKEAYFTAGAKKEKLTHLALFQANLRYDPSKTKYKVDEFIAALKKENFYSLQKGMKIYITQPPSVSSKAGYIVEVTKADGSMISAESQEITWQ